MKLIIFAGGVGTRLWPLSRENSPKQFDKIFHGKSTIQLATERIAPTFGWKNVYVQTVPAYKNIIHKQVSGLAKENIIIEPVRRNLAPAVCLAMIKLKKAGYGGPVALLWADHLMKRVNQFSQALKIGEKLILKNPNRFVFLAERPRFANNNLGWIKIGPVAGKINRQNYYSFKGWKYKPEINQCRKMYSSGQYFWNPGYFITSVDFLLAQYKQLAPDIYRKVAAGDYKKAQPIHFDEAIVEKVDLKKAVVIKTDLGWSDPGTLYALKEALETKRQSNVTKGLTSLLDTKDSLVYNLAADKLVAAVGLRGMVIVNTADIVLVVPKDEVVKVTKLIEQLKQAGLKKYL